MYMKDKERRITLRLNQEQFDFLSKDCETLGITPSAYLRMIINTTMTFTKTAQQSLNDVKCQKVAQDDIGEKVNASNDDKNNFDDIV